jgi:F0F1-type ATP synthase assembly protein I
VSNEEQTVVKASARIDWRKLLLPTLFVMVLPTISAFLLDKWLGSLPFITIAAILVCFPTATFLVIRIALQEMDRVIAEVAPPILPESDLPPETSGVETGVTPEADLGP